LLRIKAFYYAKWVELQAFPEFVADMEFTSAVGTL
jgi:hypothetical protein